MGNASVSSTIASRPVSKYSRMSLLELISCIVDKRNRKALEELHNNRRLPITAHRPFSLIEYLNELKNSVLSNKWYRTDPVIIEDAYNLTIDKFSNMPKKTRAGQKVKQTGPDCRYYLMAFLECAAKKMKKEPPKNSIEEELMASEILRKMVLRHFYFSILECRRKNQKLVRRYLWKIRGKTLTVWMPITILGKECRNWLEKNIPDVHPLRPSEHERVQEIIDRLLPRQSLISLDKMESSIDKTVPARSTISSILEKNITVEGLAEVVANEKAENLKEQRQAIKELGQEKLKKLIHVIFDNLADSKFEANKISKKFGLSKATLSRFAGIRWGTPNDGKNLTIPDLWKNTAHMLAHHGDFMRAAKRAGVWEKVCQIADVKSSIEEGERDE